MPTNVAGWEKFALIGALRPQHHEACADRVHTPPARRVLPLVAMQLAGQIACRRLNRLRQRSGRRMKTNYVLVDYENVQPKDFGLLRDGPFRVKLFLGPNQSKIPVSLAAALQALGGSAEYVPLEASGANALDFHIAYYIGVLSTHEPSAFFHIISKDAGFDPLIKHLKGKGVFARRSTCIAEMPVFRPAIPEDQDAQVEAVIENLSKRKAAKPRTQKSLLTTINARFKNELTEQQLLSLFTTLCKRGLVQVDGTKVSYSLPRPCASATVGRD